MITSSQTFQRSGLASLDDLDTREWLQIFNLLENVQNEFLSITPHTPAYRWPRDPLHTCIRAWEYPFVYSNLQLHRNTQQNGLPTVVDLGSGATFFPFAVSQLGYQVIAIDLDLESGRSLSKALNYLPTEKNSVQFLNGDVRNIPLPNKSVECVYCISVLEHLPEPEAIIAEVFRILRPDGLFILTFDIDLNGNHEIGPEMYTKLRKALDKNFEGCYSERFVHPLRILTSDNSPYPYYSKLNMIDQMKLKTKQCLYKFLAHHPYQARILASTYGICLKPSRK